MLFTEVILIDDIDLACDDFLTDTTAVANRLKETTYHNYKYILAFHLEVFLTDWLIFECKEPFSNYFSTHIALKITHKSIQDNLAKII